MRSDLVVRGHACFYPQCALSSVALSGDLGEPPIFPRVTAEIWAETCGNKELVKRHYDLSETNGQIVYATLCKQHHRCGVPAGASWLWIQAWRHPEGVAIAFAPPAEVKKDLPRLPLMGWEKAFRRFCPPHPPPAVSYSPSQTLCANYKVANLRLWTGETEETYIRQERVLVHTPNLCSLTCCPIHTIFLITTHLFFFFCTSTPPPVAGSD